MTYISRRKFLKGLGAVGTLLTSETVFGSPLRYFKPTHVENPLAFYPNRDWEKVYRNIFKPDSTFVFLCAPNDTHNCLLTRPNGLSQRKMSKIMWRFE